MIKVEVYTEVLATKPHPAGGEMYDKDGGSEWILNDHIHSDDREIVGSFLLGLAEELDPKHNTQVQNRNAITVHSNWKVLVTERQRGTDTDAIVAQIVSKRPKVLASMLRGTAKSIGSKQVSIGTVLRSAEDND